MELLVAADDRTGAFETAAALADRGAGPVPVSAWPAKPPAATVAVVDLGSRHALVADAARRAATLPSAARQAHKIDSTLRGNWAEELGARAATHPVLLVPALPAFGRTCVGGVVLEHGRPVHEGTAGTDVRRRVCGSRPADALRAAGAGGVVELADPAAIGRWLEAPSGVAVADAADTAAIDAAVTAWATAPTDVVLAGTSAVIGAAAPALGMRAAPARPPAFGGPVLVACGSVHPAARRQLAAAGRAGHAVTLLADDLAAGTLRAAGVLILATEIPVGDVDAPLAAAAAAALAGGVTELLRQVGCGALIVLGGDTVAAVAGDASVVVHGSIGVGTAWAEVAGFDQPVITRSGGFGSEHALVELIGRCRTV